MSRKNKSIIGSYEELNDLIDSKRKLKQSNQVNTSQYTQVEGDIQKLVDSLSKDEFKGVAVFFNEEYKNLVSIYNADLAKVHKQRIENKLDNYEEFLNIYSKRKNAEKTQGPEKTL